MWGRIYIKEDKCVCMCKNKTSSKRLTQLVEVCVNAMRSWYRADQSDFDEGAPFVHQHSLATNIILAEKTEIQYTQSIKHRCVFNFKYTVSLFWLYTPADWIQTI